MSKKSIGIIVIVIIILVGVGIGVYALMHQPSAATLPKTPSASSTAPTTSSTDTIIQTKTSSSAGQYLADENGSALYTYNGDTNGVSNCNGTCLLGWPVYAPGNPAPTTLPANVTIIARSDGTPQFAYKGMPLYTFSGDVNGNVSGDGVSNFAVARP